MLKRDMLLRPSLLTSGIIDRERRLIVGGVNAKAYRGDRRPQYVQRRAFDVTINNDPAALADVTADIARLPAQLARGNFRYVIFENVEFKSFTGSNIGAIRQAAAALEPGGRLVILTGGNAPTAEITVAMRAAGFGDISVTGATSVGQRAFAHSSPYVISDSATGEMAGVISIGKYVISGTLVNRKPRVGKVG